jgi:hypothetical protein
MTEVEKVHELKAKISKLVDAANNLVRRPGVSGTPAELFFLKVNERTLRRVMADAEARDRVNRVFGK